MSEINHLMSPEARQRPVRVPGEHHPGQEPHRQPPGHRASHTDPRRGGHLRGGGRHHEPHLHSQGKPEYAGNACSLERLVFKRFGKLCKVLLIHDGDQLSFNV